MQQKYCVFNITKESFLSLGVTKAETTWARLSGLVGKRYLKPDEGLWIAPSQGIHTFGMLFAIDAVYLDKQGKVVELVERLLPFRLGPVRMAASCVIELPERSIRSSQTEVGDQFLICTPEELANYLKQREAFRRRHPEPREIEEWERRKLAGEG